jgi:hypothetical protein
MIPKDWFRLVALPIIVSHCVDDLDEAPRSELKKATARIEALEDRLAEVETSPQDESAHSGLCTCE